MLPDTTRIGCVTLQVADLDRSLAFYVGVLGFCERSRADHGGRRVARLGHLDAPRPLLELVEKPGVRPVPPRGLLGLYHFAVLLPSRVALGQFILHAANRVRMGAADHLVSEALYLVDPDGLTIEVYRDRPREEWRHANGEIEMASLPLDFDTIVAAVGDAPPWSGLPGGTTIGHMHFYVGDLAQAEAFYVHRLGFTPTVRSYPGALFVAAGGYHHHVGLNTWAAHMPVATDDDARLLGWELIVPDYRGPDAQTDPWGNVVRLTRR